MKSAASATSASSSVLWAGIQLALFVAFAALFYRFFPQFLMQNHDSQNVYFTLTRGWEWRASMFEIYAYSPLAALGTTFWPFLFPAIPYLAVLGISSDPTLRIYLLQIAASATLFAGALFFFCALDLGRRIANAASWMTFAVIMLYGLAPVSAPENLAVTVWMYVALGALAWMGSGSLSRDLAWGALFQVAVLGFVLAVPAWHIIALPVIGVVSLALILTSDSRRQRAWRAASVGIAAAIQLAAGTYDALRYTITDTARIALREQFAVNPHFQQISGHLMNDAPIDMLVGALFIIGMGWSRRHDFAAPAGRAVHGATLFLYAVFMVTGAVFYYTSGPWPLPWPKYLFMFAYPLTALFAAIGVRVLIESRLDGARMPLVGALLGVYALWHLFSNFSTALPSLLFAGAVCGGAALAGRLNARLLALAVIVAGLAFGCLRYVAAAFGGGADARFDGALRAGIVRTPLAAYLADRVGVAPGQPFRGLVEDIYSRAPGSKDLIDTIIGHWARNWMAYGNGHKLFAWNAMGIPIAAEYNQYTRPPYFLLYTRLLNEPDDRQVFNYLSATRADVRILAMLGVRYIVTDEAAMAPPTAQEVFRWDKFRVLELARPNLANYSPTRTLRASSAEQALKLMADWAFDPRDSVVLHEDPPSAGSLLRADASQLIFDKGGFRITARSSGRSLLLAPVQFSHCFVMEGGAGARMVRANLALTAFLFDSRLEATVRYRRWPFASTECQRRDLEDSRRLLADM